MLRGVALWSIGVWRGGGLLLYVLVSAASPARPSWCRHSPEFCFGVVCCEVCDVRAIPTAPPTSITYLHENAMSAPPHKQMLSTG